MNPKPKPKFRRQRWRLRRLAAVWRAPRGVQSKQRIGMASRGPLPQPGYGAPAAVRGLHPCGCAEVLITSPEQLRQLDPATQVARIAHVGNLKRLQIQALAEQLKIKVLNLRQVKIRRKEKK